MRLLIWFSLVVLTAGASDCWAGELKVGVATAEITPPLGGPLWGYAARRDAPSRGVRDPLFAKVVVIDDGTERVMVASLDLGRTPPRSQMAGLRQALAKLRIKNMLVVASHTHNGPVMELENWPDADNPYCRKVADKLGELAQQAISNARPTRLSSGTRETTMNRNRQSKRSDAQVDRELRVIRFDDLDGKPIVTLVNFAAHPTMLDAKLLEFSADYPGAMAKHVERVTGAPCLFLQGASGDLSAKPPPNLSGPDEFGKELADEVISLSKDLQSVKESIPIRGTREEFTFKCNLDVRDPVVKLAVGRAFFPALVECYEREYAKGSRPEFTAVTFGKSMGMVGFSGEMFCGHSLSLKRRARLDHLLVFGCCNDYQQYFPTIEAMAEGGYGTVPPVAMAEAGAGEKMTDAALLSLYRLRGMIPGR